MKTIIKILLLLLLSSTVYAQCDDGSKEITAFEVNLYGNGAPNVKGKLLLEIVDSDGKNVLLSCSTDIDPANADYSVSLNGNIKWTPTNKLSLSDIKNGKLKITIINTNIKKALNWNADCQIKISGKCLGGASFTLPVTTSYFEFRGKTNSKIIEREISL